MMRIRLHFRFSADPNILLIYVRKKNVITLFPIYKNDNFLKITQLAELNFIFSRK